MDDYKKYLAEQVVSEDKIVTYRSLSRALKVNVNVSKQMLYDFHSWQNGKKPGTVHATYMIYGTKKIVQTNGHSQQDEDVEMTSSPPESAPQTQEVPLKTLSLVAEGNLGDVLAEYEQVTAIHVYSIGPHPVKLFQDMQLLADVSRPPTLGTAASFDSVGLGPTRNPYVRRRDRRNAAPRVVAAATEPAKTKQAPATLVPAEKVKEEPKTELKPSSKESTPTSSGTKKPAAKRGASGGIMQSFAKAATMPKKASKPKPAASAEETNVQDLALSDDGEDDSLAMPEPEEENDTARKNRQDRQDALKRMMEESSEDDESEKEDTLMDDAEAEPPAPEPEAKEDTEPAEVVSSTGDGRRRGKRQVMKKKTVMDEQGYLVTVQEKGWESFSEDEPVPASKKKVETASQPAKPKKAAPKGQGNIMSFFSKK
ncbi:CDC27 protein [Gnomoniopsis sp. IMI 355080]|nr:CDC27 protein [Gnomoniopsis sp. IMI 355080]